VFNERRGLGRNEEDWEPQFSSSTVFPFFHSRRIQILHLVPHTTKPTLIVEKKIIKGKSRNNDLVITREVGSVGAQ
ncbi:hypothetical protein V4Y02_23855, partial [Escherichia coli]